MDQALTYFLITALSYPAVALQQTAAALFRADGRSKPPMVVSACANGVNIIGNAILIFGCGLGVAGAALATLFSRILSAVVLLALLRAPHLTLRLDHYLSIRPQWGTIKTVLAIGVPAGVENALFQVGKLAVQSTVSTLGTAAIAAQAMTATLEAFQSTPCQAAGLALLTVAGQCMGADRVDETKQHTRTLCFWSEGILAIGAAVVLGAFPLVRWFSSMSQESADLTWRLLVGILAFKMFSWVIAFTLPNTLRASGDVAFTATVSGVTMWVFRVGLSTVLVRVLGFGLEGVWIGWCVDWLFRDIFYVWRYRSGRWAKKKVLS
jgi:putative MATE family efflux protein